MQNKNLPKYIEILKELLSFPSVAALPERQNDSIQAGEFVEREFHKLGFETSLHVAESHEKEPPVVIVRKITDPANPTVLFYCHYDVQPADENGWIFEPFTPTEKDGHIYARGSIDDKGPLITLYAALSELKEEWGDNWPINVICLFEGQEESSSPNLKVLFTDENFRKLVQADTAIMVDGLFADNTTPAVEYGLRGIVHYLLHVRRGDFSVHSGIFGGAILNPIHVLADIITKIYDVQTGKILLPEFYSNVEELDPEEKKHLANLPFSEEEFLKNSGNTKVTFGEAGYSIKELTTARPTFDVNGMWGGYTSKASKTIIPEEAYANISFRLVPNQSSKEINEILATFIESLDYPGMTITCIADYETEPSKSPINSLWNRALAEALEEIFGIKPVFERSGGSGAEASLVKNYLGIDPVFIGYARPEDNYHGVNEKLSLELFEKGIEANKLILKKFAKIKQ